MADSLNKKEQQKRKDQKKKEKEERKAERKANAKSGKSLDDMIAYVDENGNLSSTPPDPLKKKIINDSDIVLGSRNIGSAQPDVPRTGKITHFNDSKGYGFIKDSVNQESIFVHVKELDFQPRENDKVSFDVVSGVKGPNAVNVKKIS